MAKTSETKKAKKRSQKEKRKTQEKRGWNFRAGKTTREGSYGHAVEFRGIWISLKFCDNYFIDKDSPDRGTSKRVEWSSEDEEKERNRRIGKIQAMIISYRLTYQLIVQLNFTKKG